MRWALLLVGLLLAAPAGAEPADALSGILRSVYLEARAREADGEWEEAASRYRMVRRGDPGFTHAVVDLGRVLQAAGRPDEAEAVYRSEPYDPDAVEALGRLYLSQERWGEAAHQFERLTDLRMGWPGAHLLLAEALAPLDAPRAEEVFRQLRGYAGVDLDVNAARVAVLIHDALRGADEPDAAQALLEDLVDYWPEAEGVEAVEERLILNRVEDEAEVLMSAAARPLPVELRDDLEEARSLVAEGDHGAAATHLERILAAAPNSPEVWGVLSEVHEAQGDIAAAERAALMAQALAPMDPAVHARLGDLLSTHYGGRYDVGALEAYQRALQYNPAWDEVVAKEARLCLRTGDPQCAREAWGGYLALAPEGPHAEEARAGVQGFVRVRPEPPVPPEADPRPAAVPQEAWERFHLAWAWADREEYDTALEELAAVRAVAPDFARAFNLEASIRLELGQTQAAVDLYLGSLDREENQPRVYEVLLRIMEPDEVGALAERASAAGVGDAWFRLAWDAWDEGRAGEALAHLDRYFASERSGDLDEEARALQEEARASRRTSRLLGLGVGGLLVVGGPLLWWRRRTGNGLAALLERSPAAWPDVARTCSAIRHEVLKHNTTVLAAVADALDAGDAEPAAWAHDKLFGDRGAVARFREHVRSLELLGRVHGVRLNLRYRDATFAPLLAAMDRLGRVERDLQRGSGRRLSLELRLVSVALNQEGYRALGRLIRRAYLLQVDAELLRGAWDRVRAEPAFRGREGVDLGVEVPEGEALLLRIYRGELEDILANVLRNSLAATLEAGGERMALRVECEEDEITGLERVALRVADPAPRTLSTALIRSRYVERGLGLTVDLISRAGGSIHVEDEPGWTKAVVVRLPRAELPDEEE